MLLFCCHWFVSHLVTLFVFFILPVTPFFSFSLSSFLSPCFIALWHSISEKVQWSQVAALKSSSAAPPSISRSHSFSEPAPSLAHTRAQQHPSCPELPPHLHEEPPRVSTGPDDSLIIGSLSDCSSMGQLFLPGFLAWRCVCGELSAFVDLQEISDSKVSV